MDKFLVNITTPDFTAVVPPISSMPANKIIEMMSLKDPMEQFVKALEMFRNALSEDKVDELDELNMEQTILVINKWASEESDGE
jgi:hypothetical protein